MGPVFGCETQSWSTLAIYPFSPCMLMTQVMEPTGYLSSSPPKVMASSHGAHLLSIFLTLYANHAHLHEGKHDVRPIIEGDDHEGCKEGIVHVIKMIARQLGPANL